MHYWYPDIVICDISILFANEGSTGEFSVCIFWHSFQKLPDDSRQPFVSPPFTIHLSFIILVYGNLTLIAEHTYCLLLFYDPLVLGNLFVHDGSSANFQMILSTSHSRERNLTLLLFVTFDYNLLLHVEFIHINACYGFLLKANKPY